MPRLVLARKQDERIVLHRQGELVAVIKVVDLRGCTVRLGTDARSDLDVDRDHVYEAKYGKIPENWHMEDSA